MLYRNNFAEFVESTYSTLYSTKRRGTLRRQWQCHESFGSPFLRNFKGESSPTALLDRLKYFHKIIVILLDNFLESVLRWIVFLYVFSLPLKTIVTLHMCSRRMVECFSFFQRFSKLDILLLNRYTVIKASTISELYRRDKVVYHGSFRRLNFKLYLETFRGW